MDIPSQMKSAAAHLKKELGEIPPRILKYAKGIVFLTLVKGAFVWSGSLATGIIVKRLPGAKWSPPVSIGMASVGFGLQAGAQKVDVIIVIGDDEEINTFAGTGQLKLGMEYGIAAGPIGRDVDLSAYIGRRGLTCTMYYSRSKGVFAGFSLEGAILLSRWTTNNAFYEQKVKVKDVLDGRIAVPDAKQTLVEDFTGTLVDFELGRLDTKIDARHSSSELAMAQKNTKATAMVPTTAAAKEDDQETKELLLHFSSLEATGKDLFRTALDQGCQRVIFIADHAVDESDPQIKLYGIIGALTGDNAILLDGTLENGLGEALSDYVRVRVNHEGYEREGLVSRHVLKKTS